MVRGFTSPDDAPTRNTPCSIEKFNPNSISAVETSHSLHDPSKRPADFSTPSYICNRSHACRLRIHCECIRDIRDGLQKRRATHDRR